MKSVVAAALMLGVVGLPATGFGEKAVKFRLNWKTGAEHSPFLLAEKKGYYKAEGLSVQILGGSGSTISLQQLGAGAVEFSIVDAPVLVQGRLKGVPGRSVAVYYQRTPHTIMWNAKTHTIKSPKDLIGLKVGVATASSTYQGFRVFAQAQGIDMKKQLKLVAIGFGVGPLLAKQVDAMLAFTMNQPLSAADKGIEVGEMLLSDYGVKMYGLVLATREDLIQKDPTTVRGFLRASLRGIRRAASHPDEAMAALKKVVRQANVSRKRREWDKLVKTVLYTGGKDKRIGIQTKQGWMETQDTLYDLKLMEKKIPLAEIYTNAFQP